MKKRRLQELAGIITEVKAQVNTEQFEFTHGKKPKGTGNWAFSISKTRKPTDGDMFWPSAGGKGIMTYTDALKLAYKEAEEQGAAFIFVMP